jgi:hypothetical protein
LSCRFGEGPLQAQLLFRAQFSQPSLGMFGKIVRLAVIFPLHCGYKPLRGQLSREFRALLKPESLILAQMPSGAKFQTFIQPLTKSDSQLEFEDEPGPNPKPARNS